MTRADYPPRTDHRKNLRMDRLETTTPWALQVYRSARNALKQSAINPFDEENFIHLETSQNQQRGKGVNQSVVFSHTQNVRSLEDFQQYLYLFSTNNPTITFRVSRHTEQTSHLPSHPSPTVSDPCSRDTWHTVLIIWPTELYRTYTWYSWLRPCEC